MSPDTSSPDHAPLHDLTARSALGTGARRGIGYAIAAELLARGASVTITGRKADELAAAAESLAEGAGDGASKRILGLTGNAGDADSRAETVARTVEQFGGLHILINNV